MPTISVSITKFISNDQPGFVECIFTDAWNKKHVIHEKLPVITNKDLDASSSYPQEAMIACEIIREWADKDGRKIITITTAKPWGIESVEGKEEFDVLDHQVI